MYVFLGSRIFCSLNALRLDNLTGNNSRHADFGARQVDGDNPHPNNT